MTIKHTSLKKPATVFLFLLLSSTIMVAGNAHAGNERWKAIAGKTGEERILYDPDSIIPSGPRTFRVWIMGFDADHSPKKSREEFDCVNRIVRDVEVISEKPNRPVNHTFTPSDWHGVVRETPRGELLKILCR
jgi:hypothetical protein